MKTFRLKACMTALLACLLTLGACGDDNDTTTSQSGQSDNNQTVHAYDARLVGTWTSIISEGWEYSDDGVMLVHWKDLSALSTERWEYDGQGVEINHNTYTGDPEWDTTYFGADGKYVDMNEDGERRNGTWTAANGTLTLSYSGRTVSYTYSFDGNTLIVDEKEYEGRTLVEREVIYYQRGTFNHQTNAIDPNGTYTPTDVPGPNGGENNPTPAPTPVPEPAASFLGTLPSLWKSYLITATDGTQTQTYQVAGPNDDEYMELEFRTGGQAILSAWTGVDDEDSAQGAVTRALMAKAVRHAARRASGTFESTMLNYQVSGYNIRLFNANAELPLVFDPSTQSIVMSIDQSFDNATVSINIYFRQ